MIGAFIYLNPRFKDHPFPVMAISCLAMASRLMMMESVNIILALSPPDMLSTLFLFDPVKDNLFKVSEETLYELKKERTVNLIDWVRVFT